MPPLMSAQRKKAAATEAHSIAISDRGARFGGRSFCCSLSRVTEPLHATIEEFAAEGYTHSTGNFSPLIGPQSHSQKRIKLPPPLPPLPLTQMWSDVTGGVGRSGCTVGLGASLSAKGAGFGRRGFVNG